MKNVKLNMVLLICAFVLTNLMAESDMLEANTLSFSGDGTTESAALKNAEIKAKSLSNNNKYYLRDKTVFYDPNGKGVNVLLYYWKKPDRN